MIAVLYYLSNMAVKIIIIVMTSTFIGGCNFSGSYHWQCYLTLVMLPIQHVSFLKCAQA